MAALQTTPSLDQLAKLLAQILTEVESESAPSTPGCVASAPSVAAVGSIKEALRIMTANRDHGVAAGGEGARKGRRPNALTPSKQKCLHQYMQRFGNGSEAVLAACERVAVAVNGSDGEDGWEALRDVLLSHRPSLVSCRVGVGWGLGGVGW